MKHDKLRSVAHNVAASLAGGSSFLIGVYNLDLLRAVRQSPERKITVDFLRGAASGVPTTSRLAKAVSLFPAALPALYEKHGLSATAFRQMTACYWATPQGVRFSVKVVDETGRATETEYGGYEGRRTKILDAAGRLRPKPIRRM